MTQATQTYEQKIAQAVSAVKQIAENVYSVPSSRKGVYPHVITVDENGIANYCTCEFFQFNGWEKYGHKCFHAQAVERFVAAQQAVKAAEAIVAKPQVEYVRLATGGLVRKDAQVRKEGFSLLK